MKHFVNLEDFSADDLNQVLALSQSDQISNLGKPLESKTVALLFQKPSTRTRHSCEAAIVQLGGHPVYTRPEEVGIDDRESSEDIALALGQYHSVIAARVFQHSILERMAKVSKVPVINLLSDFSHPAQTLADLLTIKQEFGNLNEINISYIGDANNVAFSLVVGANLCGAKITVSHPKDYPFADEQIEKLKARNFHFDYELDPTQAAKNSDVIYTDAWYSMGQEDEASIRSAAFADYQINSDLMQAANNKAIFLHCLPAHRGYEVTDEVLDGPQSRIWQQAENRMHTMRGLLSFLTS